MSSRAAASASWMAVRASLRAWTGSTASVRDASRAERAASKGSALVSDMILREAQRGAERRSRRRGIERLVDAAGSRAAKGKNVSAQAGPWLVRLAGDRVQVSAEELWSNFFSLPLRQIRCGPIVRARNPGLPARRELPVLAPAVAGPQPPLFSLPPRDFTANSNAPSPVMSLPRRMAPRLPSALRRPPCPSGIALS